MVVSRNLYDDGSISLFHVLQRIRIRRLLTVEDEIIAGFYAMYQLLESSAAVIVYDIHPDILHFHIHHPRHHTHDDDGEDDDEFGQKRITPYLQKLFLYQIFDSHSYSSLLLNLMSAAVRKNTVIPLSMLTSCITLFTLTPIIMSLRMAEI